MDLELLPWPSPFPPLLPLLLFVVLEMDTMVFYMLGKCPTTKLHPSL